MIAAGVSSVVAANTVFASYKDFGTYGATAVASCPNAAFRTDMARDRDDLKWPMPSKQCLHHKEPAE